jgi:hypothetical protein
VDTASGLTLQINSCASNAGFGGVVNPSDFVRVTNSRAILIGGRDTNFGGGEDRTYIDVLSFDMNTNPPTVNCIGHHEVGSTAAAHLWAGYVNDVELTPDESLAIVNSQNWIHVIDMSSGSIAAAFNIGTAPYAGACTPGFAADSVVTTNETAVVATTRLTPSPNSRSRPWVYLIDLVGPGTPAIVLEHELSGTSNEDLRDFDPHDVVITPNGSFAVVSASDVVGVYDLGQHTFLARHLSTLDPGGRRLRFFSEIVDSVETTDSRFVVTAYDEKLEVPQSGASYTTRLWTADVFAMPPATGPDMAPLWSYELRDYTVWDGFHVKYNGTILFTDIPHDLAIDAEKNMAVFKTRMFNVVLTDLANPDDPDRVLDLRFFGIANNWAASQTFVSDSVLIAPPFAQHVLPGQGSGIHHYALTLGASKSAGTFPNEYPIEATIDVIDLNLTPPARVHSFVVKDPAEVQLLYPADFHLGPGAREFVLRCTAYPNDPPPAVGGRDFVRFNLGTLTEVARIGGSGNVFAVDSMEVGRTKAVSLGEQASTSTGFIHVVDVQ